YDGQVLVAPRISGNGSLVDRKEVTVDNADTLYLNEHAGVRGVLDSLDSAVCTQGLPDDDLFVLDQSTGTTKAVAISTGTLLFAHAVQPGTSTLWQLNLDANNKNPEQQTEASIRGEIVANRISKIKLPDLSGTFSPIAPSEILSLDD